MPIFHYGGIELDLDHLVYLVARVSSDRQTEQHGGGGIERQLSDFHAFAAEFHVQEYTGLGSLIDNGTSGSSGRTLRQGAALHRFLENIKRLPPKTGLVVKSFSRLYRLHIDKALPIFFDIVCENGVPLITLQSRRAYTRASVRGDKGMMHGVLADMQAARDLADNIGFYSRKSWRNRRGTASNVLPAWIMRTVNGERVESIRGFAKAGVQISTALDPNKHPIVVRFCQMALEMGVDQIARTLNAEGVPVLSHRKRKRVIELWDRSVLLRILRSRTLLGEQEDGCYVDGKRVVTPGVYERAYPAAIDQNLFDRIQAKLDSRLSGPHTGRNVERMRNLFGPLLRCECGGRMKVHLQGPRQKYVYVGCSHARLGGCPNPNLSETRKSQYFRLDWIECKVLPWVANFVIDEPEQDDKTEIVNLKLAKAKDDAAKIERAYQRAMLRSGELAERTAAKLERDHVAKVVEVTKLQRELSSLETAEPMTVLQQAVGSVLDRALAGDVIARGKIATALPGLLAGVTCRFDGAIEVGIRGQGANAGWTKPLRIKL